MGPDLLDELVVIKRLTHMLNKSFLQGMLAVLVALGVGRQGDDAPEHRRG